MIPSKGKLIPLAEIGKAEVDYLFHIGNIPPDFSIKSKDGKIHAINIKKELSLEDKRDFIKKKILKFLSREGLFAL